MITTSLQGFSLTQQMQCIVALEHEALRQGTTAVYLSYDIDEHYRNTIFRKLNMVDVFMGNEKPPALSKLTFDEYTEDDKILFVLSPEAIKEVDDPITTAVCIGNKDSFPVSYYKDAMEFIGDSAFIFLCDDSDWINENFPGENVFLSPLTDPVEQLSLIARCSNVIIGDSEQGIWGAWLGQTIYSKIVLPADSFTNFAPSSWYRI